MSRWWWPSDPKQAVAAVPWLAPRVVARLEEIVQPDWTIIEHGAGGSTLWFAERAARVTAVEGKTAWADRVEAQAEHLDNVHIHRGTLASLLADRTERADLLLIDGEPIAERARWLRRAPELVVPGGWVILDNANRPEYPAERLMLARMSDDYFTMDSNEGSTKFLVTDFFRLPGPGSEE